MLVISWSPKRPNKVWIQHVPASDLKGTTPSPQSPHPWPQRHHGWFLSCPEALSVSVQSSGTSWDKSCPIYLTHRFFLVPPRLYYVYPLSTSVILSFPEEHGGFATWAELRRSSVAEEAISQGVSNVLLAISLDFCLYPYIPRYKPKIKPKASFPEQSHSLNLTLLGGWQEGFHHCPAQSLSQLPETRSAKQLRSVSVWRIKSYLCKQYKQRFSLTNIQKIENSCKHCVWCPAE